MTTPKRGARLLPFAAKPEVDATQTDRDLELAPLLDAWQAPQPTTALDRRLADSATQWRRKRRYRAMTWASCAAALVLVAALARPAILEAAVERMRASITAWLATSAAPAPAPNSKKERGDRPRDVVLPQPLSVPVPRPAPPMSIPRPARLALEVRALALLVRADIHAGRQVTVSPTSSGLRIAAVTDTDDERRTMRRVLGPVLGEPAISLDLHASTDATAPAVAPRHTTPRVVDIEQRIPPALDVFAPSRRQVLIDRLGREPLERELDTELTRVATAVLRQSREVLVRALAFADLSERFSDRDLSDMPEAAYYEWRGVVRSTATVLRRELATLEEDVRPLAGGVRRSDASETTGSDHRAVARRLDEQLRTAFAVSAANTHDSVDAHAIADALGQLTEWASQGEQWVGR